MARAIPFWLAAAMLVPAAPAMAVQTDAQAEVARAEQAFAAAVAGNDVAAVAAITAEDWRIIDGDGHVIPREAFLAVIRSGALRHSEMSSSEQSIRIYGDTAVVTARARSAGTYEGAAFATDEISTDVLIRRHGRWRCVLTQLTTRRP
jgi:ketosteroid isomerase-like protein